MSIQNFVTILNFTKIILTILKILQTDRRTGRHGEDLESSAM
jgi:hypothetical protein